MNRDTYTHLRSQGRAMLSMMDLAAKQLERGDVDLLRNTGRAWEAEPNLAKAMGICLGTKDDGESRGAFGAPIQAMLRDPALKAKYLPRYLSHFRLNLYFRKRCLLPR